MQQMTVTRDRTTQVISVEVSGVPDIDVTQHYHRKPRAFRPDRAIVTIVDGEVLEVKASGGLVLKSGAASTETRERWEWHSARTYGLGGTFENAPKWVTTLVHDAPAGVVRWAFTE